MDESIYFVYCYWFVKSGEELWDFFCFFYYFNFVYEVDECDLLIDIYVLLKQRFMFFFVCYYFYIFNI